MSRAKSVNRTAIKLAFSGMTKVEFQEFEDLLKYTMKKIDVVNTQYQTQNLMDRIKDKGSLYGKQTEFTEEMIEKQQTMQSISKPENLMKSKLVFNLYE
jgi:hypothetical protein